MGRRKGKGLPLISNYVEISMASSIVLGNDDGCYILSFGGLFVSYAGHLRRRLISSVTRKAVAGMAEGWASCLNATEMAIGQPRFVE
ncbi:hypothetical protein D3C76_398220 [compost metagenome]